MHPSQPLPHILSPKMGREHIRATPPLYYAHAVICEYSNSTENIELKH